MSSDNWLRKVDDLIYLAPKLIFLAVSLAYYTVYLYRAKFIREYLHLQDSQYGDLTALMAIISCVAAPLWGSLADRWVCHRLILVLLSLATLGSFQACYLMAGLPSQNSRFVWSLIIWGAFAFFSSALLPLTDYLVLKMLSRREGFNKDQYSQQVVFGTLGYGLASLLVGYSVEVFGLEVLFILLPVTTIISVLAVLIMAPADESSNPVKSQKIHKRDELNPQSSVPSKEGRKSKLARLLTNPNFMFMLLAVFLTGSARAVMTTFVGKYWSEHMNLADGQIGIAANFGIALEVVIFVFGPQLIRILDVYWMLLLAQLAMVARAWAYVVMPITASSFLVYCIELFKGVGFGFTQISGTKVACDTAPHELSATAQALYTTFYSQLPLVVTAIAGGRCYQYYGPALMFNVTAIAVTIAFFLCALKYLFDGSISLPHSFSRRTRSSLPPKNQPIHHRSSQPNISTT